MPTLAYLSIHNKPIFTDEWQIYVFLAVVVIGIIVLIVGIYKSRRL
jgi:hypothetical protein